MKKCSFKTCFCGKKHNKPIHFPRDLKKESLMKLPSSAIISRSNELDRQEVIKNDERWNKPFIVTNLVENKTYFMYCVMFIKRINILTGRK